MVVFSFQLRDISLAVVCSALSFSFVVFLHVPSPGLKSGFSSSVSFSQAGESAGQSCGSGVGANFFGVTCLWRWTSRHAASSRSPAAAQAAPASAPAPCASSRTWSRPAWAWPPCRRSSPSEGQPGPGARPRPGLPPLSFSAPLLPASGRARPSKESISNLPVQRKGLSGTPFPAPTPGKLK